MCVVEQVLWVSVLREDSMVSVCVCSTLCYYDLRNGDLFVLSCARV